MVKPKPTTVSRRKSGPKKQNKNEPRRNSQPITRAPLFATQAVLNRNSMPTNNVNTHPTTSFGNSRPSDNYIMEVHKLRSELEVAVNRYNDLSKANKDLNHNYIDLRQHFDDIESKNKALNAELKETQQLRRQLEIDSFNQKKSLSDQSKKIRELTEEKERIRSECRVIVEEYQDYSDSKSIEMQKLQEFCRILEAGGSGPTGNEPWLEPLLKENSDLKDKVKKLNNSLNYYKRENKTNKTRQMSNAFRFEQLQRQYRETVQAMYKNEQDNSDALLTNAMELLADLINTTKLEAKEKINALLAANQVKMALTEAGAKQLEETKPNERFACPHAGCGFSSETGGGLKTHMTVKHFDNDNNIIDTITLDDESDEMEV